MVEQNLNGAGGGNPQQQQYYSSEQLIVPKDGPQYRQFIKKIEVNCRQADTKLSVCLLCWGFLSYFQKKRHQEHAHYTVTPVYFKNEELFVNLARKHGKLYDNETKVAIFADTVPIQHSGSYSMGQGGPKPGSLIGNFGPSNGKMGAGSQVQELRMVSQKQIEHEQHIKRLNQIINSLCEESKIKDRRIKQLEATFVQIQQQLCPQSSVSKQGGVMEQVLRQKKAAAADNALAAAGADGSTNDNTL